MTIAANDFDYVRSLVNELSGISLEPGKEYLVESRLHPVARDQGYGGLAKLIEALRRQTIGTLHWQVAEALATNETSFFRDKTPFEALRNEVLPAVIEQRRSERRIAIWSGACSTGQEPFSIAMLIQENFPELMGWRIDLIASDFSETMIKRSQSGRFSQNEVSRGLSSPMLVKYFRRSGMEWEVNEEIRKMVTFRQLNLARPWTGVPRMDIIFLRNVLIYFDVKMKQQILGRIRDVLRPDGYLFLGGAETTLNLDDRYVRVPVSRATCYQPGK